ncbi:hypothetical protein DM860_006071 [Cuscuta australis]|uniref:Calcium-transporting P-type ATPase N-terminal autoinhibitory domain-containing protein n=1 Tax=Cuscuta australis TaxID=267555 RepID=A0A328DJU9_9ASTE|nr:hypothetical protein DM860_006071 [Cuscuta australis]
MSSKPIHPLLKINPSSKCWRVMVRVIRLYKMPVYNDEKMTNSIEMISMDEHFPSAIGGLRVAVQFVILCCSRNRQQVPAKYLSEEAQRRWRNAMTLVRNRRRRFHYIPNLEKRSETKEKMPTKREDQILKSS